MAERSSEPDGGCLSMLSSCLKKRGKARRDVPKSSQKEAVASKIPAALSSKPSPTSPATSPMPAPTGDDSRTPMSRSDGAPGELPPVAEAKPVNANLLPDEAPIEVNDTTTFSGLWFEAYKELSDDTRKWIDDKTKFADTKDPIQELADLVRTREEEYVNKTPTLRVGDREIIWRDYAERVVSWLITIGDISITFAPAPSPVVWSAVKTLLTTNLTQCNDLVAVLGCTDNVLGLVRRGRVYEGVYLEKSPLTAFQEKLKETLIETYKTCLEFLAYMNAKFKLSQVGQFIDVLLDPQQGKQKVSELKALESTLFQAAQSCGTENIQVETAKQTELLESLHKPLKRIDNKVEQVLDILEENERQKALEFVSTIRVGADHTTITDARTEKTCEWLIGNAEFREWEESSSSSLFWLQVGTGKSFLSSKVVDRYRVDENGSSQCLNHHDEAFAYFYCRRSDPDRQNIRPIVRSFVRQLGEVPRRPGKIHQALYKLVENSKSVQKTAGLDDYKHALVEMINTYPRTTLVLDALDECDLDTRAQLAEFLRELVEESTRLLKVFVASRKESDIECSFALFEDQQMLVEISTEDNKGDIEKFVDEKLIKVKRYWTFYDKDRMEKLAKDTLLEKSDAMFRWTYLQCERLKKCRTEDALKMKLGNLPETLSEAYDEIYNDPDREPSDLLMLQRAVRWVACARQPLDSCTLLSAMRAETEMVDGENALKRSDLTEMTLESVCRHLVVKDTGLGTWKCAHASVTEYFAEKGQPWFKDAEVEVAVVLINCLTDCCSNYPWGDSELEAKSTISAIERWFEWRKADPDNILDPRHPLQTYTHLNWLHHIHGIRDGHPRATDVACALKRFFGGSPHVCSKEYDTFRRTIMCGYWRYYAVMYNRMECNPHPEFGVIALGLHRVLDGWWDKELPSLMKSRGDDLLKTAIAFGHNDLCKRLVGQEGCSLNRDARSMYDSPIGTAIHYNNVGALKLILERGANPNRLFRGHSLLCEALRYGAEIIRTLLAKGANPDIRCNDGPASPHNCSFDCALSKAASNGKLDVLEALVEYGADVNPGNLQDEYGSPLTAAAANGKLDCALFLINHGAKVDPQLECGRFGSVLAAAAYSGSLETVQFLVQQHNVDVRTNLKVGDFGSSLTAAVTEGHVDCANFLIQHGADVNAYMEFGRYGSNMAAAILGPSSSLAMVKFLVENTDLNTTWRTVVQPRDKDERRQYMTYGTDVERIRIVMYLIRDLNIKAEMLISIGICPIAVEYGELDMESLVERLNEDLRAGRIDRK